MTMTSRALYNNRISPGEHTVLKLGREVWREKLLKIHHVLPNLMVIVQWKIVETGAMLLQNSYTTLLQQRSRFETE